MAQTKAQPQQIWGTELDANDSSAKEMPGVIRWEYDDTYGLRAYRYVQAASDTTVANGTALGFSDAYRMVASSDCDDYDENQPSGVGIGVITASYYGWIQCYGYHAVVKTNGDDDIADGDNIILDAAVDGVVNSVAAGTAPTDTPLGIAVAEDSNANNTVATFLTCL